MKNNISKTKAEMSFIEHLEELRFHLIRSLTAIAIFSIGFFIFRDWIFDHVITGPIRKDFISYRLLCRLSHKLGIGESLCMPPVDITMQSNTFGGQFLNSISMALIGGFITSFPYIFWEIWNFVKPALKENELKKSNFIIFWVSFFFFSGASFGYFILGPFTFNFLAGFQLGTEGLLITKPTLSDYIENLTNIIIGCGLSFELPVLSYLLTKIGLISPSILVDNRKIAIVIILVIAAFITPSPDWMSQIIVFLPLWMLYELSVLISKTVADKQADNPKTWE